jgi:hypothetical protein
MGKRKNVSEQIDASWERFKRTNKFVMDHLVHVPDWVGKRLYAQGWFRAEERQQRKRRKARTTR